jgi:regulatory protein YycI of two-component signal transduction system YycFG
LDFRRVKAILIVVFLLLNLFLAYQWSSLRSAVLVYAEPASDQLANVQSALARQGVTFAVSPPLGQPGPMPLLRAKFDRVSPTAFAAAALPGRARPVKGKKPLVTLASAAGEVRVTGTGRFAVTLNARSRAGRVPVTSAHTAQDVKGWLQKHGYDPSAYQLLYVQNYGTSRVITYAQTYDGYPVFNALLTARVAGHLLAGYDQTALSVQPAMPARTVTGAAAALLSLSSFVDKAHLKADNTVVSIELGYESKIVSPDGWVLTPVWRIGTVRGVFYINAFTGEVGVGRE